MKRVRRIRVGKWLYRDILKRYLESCKESITKDKRLHWKDPNNSHLTNHIEKKLYVLLSVLTQIRFLLNTNYYCIYLWISKLSCYYRINIEGKGIEEKVARNIWQPYK